MANLSGPPGETQASPELSEVLPAHGVRLPHTAFSVAVDRIIRGIGNAVSYVWLLLLAVIVFNVVIRYLLGQGRIEFEELQWHLYAVGFLIGLSYCLESDEHVRVDIIKGQLGLRSQAWLELFGILFFLLPFIGVVTFYAIPFATYAFAIGEVSEAPGGLPVRWVIKAVLPLAFVLLAIATLSRLTRVTACLFGRPSPRFPGSE